MVRLVPRLIFALVLTGLGWNFKASPVNYSESNSVISVSFPEAKAQMLNSAISDQVHQGSEPVLISIPEISLSSPIIPVDLNKQGIVDTPDNEVGWYLRSASVGQDSNMVLSGHFVGLDMQKGVFYDLKNLKKRSRLEVKARNGLISNYEVYETELVKTEDFPVRKVYGKKSEASLHIITCAGTFESTRGTYSHRTVIYARKTN